MKVWRIQVNTALSQWDERSTHIVSAPNSISAIAKACAEAKRNGTYKSYDAESVELIGDAL